MTKIQSDSKKVMTISERKLIAKNKTKSNIRKSSVTSRKSILFDYILKNQNEDRVDIYMECTEYYLKTVQELTDSDVDDKVWNSNEKSMKDALDTLISNLKTNKIDNYSIDYLKLKQTNQVNILTTK